MHIRGRGLIWEGGLNRGFTVLWSAHFCTNKTNLKTYSVELTHEMTPETVHCYCIRLVLLLFFKGLKIILCVPHWCVSDLSKNVNANSNFNIQNVNISQVPIILHSCRPTLLPINLISVPLWDFMYCPLNLQLYIIYFSTWFYLMFRFFTDQELIFGAITFIQVPYQYRPLCYFLSYKRNMGKDWCWNWRGKRNPWTTKRGNPL